MDDMLQKSSVALRKIESEQELLNARIIAVTIKMETISEYVVNLSHQVEKLSGKL
jgi:predicted  nucleic acid-binding Zn-ribbon protein